MYLKSRTSNIGVFSAKAADESEGGLRKLGRAVMDLIQQGNRNRFVIRKDDSQLLDMPVTVLAILLLGSFGTCAFLMVVGLFAGCRYSIHEIGAQRSSGGAASRPPACSRECLDL